MDQDFYLFIVMLYFIVGILLGSFRYLEGRKFLKKFGREILILRKNIKDLRPLLLFYLFFFIVLVIASIIISILDLNSIQYIFLLLLNFLGLFFIFLIYEFFSSKAIFYTSGFSCNYDAIFKIKNDAKLKQFIPCGKDARVSIDYISILSYEVLQNNEIKIQTNNDLGYCFNNLKITEIKKIEDILRDKNIVKSL